MLPNIDLTTKLLGPGSFLLPYPPVDLSDYQAFLASKAVAIPIVGINVSPEELNSELFLYQRDIDVWALKLGRAALFEECGLGKTFQHLEWARLVVKHTGGKVLILAPLAVGSQTVHEGRDRGIEVKHCKTQAEVGDASIIVTNYERLGQFDASQFVGVVLDESSILKSYTGATKQAIIETFKNTKYKLACTATPAPNDYLEFGNHAEFLGIMPSNEMIMRWFINDTMAAGSYRLKGHAEKDFWRWLTSWAVCLSRPGDLGAAYDMPAFKLPELKITEHSLVASAQTIERTHAEGKLIPDSNPSAMTLHKVKRESLEDRVAEAVQIVARIPKKESVVVWCDTNYEADALIKAFPGALEVRGSHSTDIKEKHLTAFSEGEARIIITKPDIAGFGLNWQHCCYQVFVGVSFSFEKLYQSIRRSYRFGQTKPVNVYLIFAETEGNVMATLKAKHVAFDEMQKKMNEAMAEHGLFRNDKRRALSTPTAEQASGDNWTLYLGDCVTETKKLADNSVDFGIHSPPFANLYIYSDSEADMGNSADDAEFFEHYKFLIRELHRTTKPGRLCAVHCKDLPAYMNRDGAAGLKDFPGQIIKAFEEAGWQYHSRVTIWKDPVIEMQRTKNHGLLHRNFANSAEACRQGMPDYLVVFRKWPIDGGREVKQQRVIGDYIGTNPPTEDDIRPGKRGREENYSIAVWQRYASPVWFDINQTNVLNYEIARGKDDDKHICPLQLDVIERCIDLWTNPGETVFSPFAGVGSEIVSAIKLGRKGIGIELKESYWRTATRYCKDAERKAQQPTLFDMTTLEVLPAGA